MKTPISKKIAEYRFQDSQKIVYATPIGNLLLVVVFAFPGILTIFTNPYALISGITGILFFMSIGLNNWQSNLINILFILVYIFILLLEWFLFGLPTSSIVCNQNFTINKGVLLEIIGGMMPYLYVGIRIFLVVPLIQMAIASHHKK